MNPSPGKSIYLTGCILITSFLFSFNSWATEDAWVRVNLLNLRACPDIRCELVDRARFHQKVNVYKTEGGWARLSRTDSPEVWASKEFLESHPPIDQTLKNNHIYRLINASDDFINHKAVFLELTEELIAAGSCTSDDFLTTGGWLKSSTYADQSIYFTYCGGIDSTNRIYLNTALGKVRR